jgi:hypothetical protein
MQVFRSLQDNEVVASIGQASRRLSMRIFRIAALAVVALGPLLTHAQWVANGRDAMLTISLPQSKKPDTNAIFIISYEKRWSCRPTVSVMLVSGRKLGAPEGQETFKKRGDLLEIVIDGKKFSGETKQTTYANGMELAMFAPIGLVDALKNQPTTVVAQFGEGLGGVNFSYNKGFSTAIASATAACN